MSNEFKIGDKVRIIHLGPDWQGIANEDPAGAAARGIVVGNTGTVVQRSEADADGVISVRTDNAGIPKPQTFGRNGWAFYPEELEKVES